MCLHGFSPFQRPLGSLVKVLPGEAGNTTLFQEPADPEDGKRMSQNNHLVEGWMSVSFIYRRLGDLRKRSEKAISLANIS